MESNAKYPLVSVTFPIHRKNDFAEVALKSVLQQTYTNLEILFLDNSELGLYRQFNLADKRIRYIKLPSTFGLAETLNAGIKAATGKYLARMDYDDVNFPNRFELQVKFLEVNQNVDILGSAIEVIGEDLDFNIHPGEIHRKPSENRELRLMLLSKNAFFHPTVMFRMEPLLKNGFRYRKSYDSAEDYEMWCRCSRSLTLANLNEPLLKYRVHESQYSRLDGENSTIKAARAKAIHALWLLWKRDIDINYGLKTLLKILLRILTLQFKKKNLKFSKFQ